MKMLMFDFRDSEKGFFEKHELKDFEITFIKNPLDEKTELTQEQLDDTVIISVFTTSNLTSDVLKKFKNLRMVATRSTAYSHIDLEYCINHNIAVFNVEQYGKTAVAEYAIALMLMLVRNILPAAHDLKNKSVNQKKYEGRVLSSYTIGILGCGAIGSVVAKIAKFFGMNVLIHSYMKNPELYDTCNFVTFDELLEKSDIITLHIPYDGDNYHMIGKSEFTKMKDGVFIVNTARGELIDTEALYNNLKSGKVKAAALDVMECENLSFNPEEITRTIRKTKPMCVDAARLTRKLFKMPNVVITPHIAYNTCETVNYLLEATFNNIRDNLKGMSTNRVC